MWTHNFSGQPTSQPAGPEAPAAVAINLPRVYLCYLQLQKRSFIVPAIISHKTATIVPFRLLCKILFAVTKSKFDSRVGSPGSGWLWLALECVFLCPLSHDKCLNWRTQWNTVLALVQLQQKYLLYPACGQLFMGYYIPQLLLAIISWGWNGGDLAWKS